MLFGGGVPRETLRPGTGRVRVQSRRLSQLTALSILRAYLQHQCHHAAALARRKVVANISTYIKHLHAVVQEELLCCA